MRIEELIIDGFKSYPVRTHVSGFDPSFNAITGLNGSGKSNILDSICFVLGITNLSAVRAANLQDLIYKRGQAGVTKASVTIVFDNSDRAKSPVGFEGSPQLTVTRQIAMGGLSKYIVNGHKSTQAKVQTIFQSVQLNINNPNFLIMQGKITKVLNMKAPEILSMIEEAAGTRMFEDRKEKAIKTITKKDQKVQEITAILAEEITPKLDKLREEKRSFLEYQKASSELERLTRLAKAYEWQSLRSRAEKQAVQLEAKRKDVQTRNESVESLQSHIQSIEKELEGIEKRREKDLLKGGKLQSLMSRAKELEHSLVKAKTLLDLKLAGIDEDNKKIQADVSLLQSLEEARDGKAAALEELSTSFAMLKAAYDASTADLQKNEELLQTLVTGVVSKKADEKGANQGGYMGQLADARALEASAGTEIEQAKLRIGHLEKELKTKEPAAKKAEKENAGLLKEMEVSRETVTKLSAKLATLEWDEEKESTLHGTRGNLQRKIADLLEKRDALKSRLAGMDFSYCDPEPNFDRSKVKGLVANLIELDEERHKYSTALEICAGGRLYNVVVEDAETGTKLLSKGGLRKRVTLIPLNKINAFVTSAEKLGAAQRIAPGKVDLALNLVGYEEDVTKAMQYVFGNTLICADAESAKRVTFDAKVRVKSVTLEGDVYDPSGTLSGGSKPSSGGVLVKLQGLHQVEKELAAVRAQLRTCEDELAAAKTQIDMFRKAKRELELKRHEADLLQAQIDGSNATRVVGEVEICKQSIASLKDSIAAAQIRSKAASAEASRLEKEMEEFNANKDSKLDELKASLKAKKAQVQKQSLTITSHQHDKRTLQLELEEAHLDVSKAQEGLKESKIASEKAGNEAKEMKVEVDRIQTDLDATSAKVESERATLSSYDAELNTLRDALKSKRQQIADEELTIKQLTHEIDKGAQECASADKSVHNLETQFEWIKEESKFFGQADTAYDFSKHNMGEIRKTCKRLEEQQQGMKKKVNPKVLNMIDSVEKKETSLNQMLSTVLKDKSMIEDTISELDRYKKDALQTTWEKVNGDFGDIFAELLPGNYAKLQPPEGQDLTQGLEVKVRLGEVWKQSLTELSGGQRSLIALSLIMSLLQFKPAPMYILDEIDAALDLSHTQHIGQLFKSRFSGSQFIVVSLKEGLFTNANVLFRARFRDGTSIVERTAQRGSLPAASAGKENAAIGNGSAAARKRTAAAGKAAPASQRPARAALGAA